MSIPTALKSAVKKIPGIKKIVAERDKLLSECERLQAELNKLVEKQNTLQAELDNLVSRHESVLSELSTVHAERSSFQSDYEKLLSEHQKLSDECGFVPPGHYFSPIPSLKEIEHDAPGIYSSVPGKIPGLELNVKEQLSLLEDLCQYYQTIPFPLKKTAGFRYYYENPAYSYSDAIFLHCMIRHLKPRRIIEIGSGFSSCAILDTNQLFFRGLISHTIIDPYPDQLLSLLQEEDRDKIKVCSQRLQDSRLSEFEELEQNDILFIDSTHISKFNSDVNRIFFEILPILSKGVYIHFHDIFYPFEYPKEWIHGGRAWNELYLLRAFLQYNTSFSMVLMNTYMEHFHTTFFRENMPLCLENTGGSIWIRKE